MALRLAAMREVGPAAQTLAGLLSLQQREIFRPVSDIAESARVPCRTCQKHLATLARKGWITNSGRERTRAGRPRRTCTLRITRKTRDATEYAPLPHWAAVMCFKGRRSPWSTRAVLTVVMKRLLAKKAAVERNDGYEADWGAIENLRGDFNWQFPLRRLVEDTGLDRKSVIAGKRHLHRFKIVDWSENKMHDGGDGSDLLIPQAEFLVRVEPAGPGYVRYLPGVK